MPKLSLVAVQQKLRSPLRTTDGLPEDEKNWAEILQLTSDGLSVAAYGGPYPYLFAFRENIRWSVRRSIRLSSSTLPGPFVFLSLVSFIAIIEYHGREEIHLL